MKALVLPLVFILATNILGETPTEENLRVAAINGGTIRFSEDGRIALGEPINVNRDLEVDSNGHVITLDGQGVTRLFSIAPGVHFVLRSLILSNGSTIARHLDEGGAAIAANGAFLTVENCVFVNNKTFSTAFDSAGGGAIYQTGGGIALRGCSFISNTVRNPNGTARGGAMFVAGSDTAIEGTLFETNAVMGLSSDGGAVSVFAGALTANTTVFRGNSAGGEFNGGSFGGAISATEPAGLGGVTVSLTNCSFVLNEAVVTRDTSAVGLEQFGPTAWGGAVVCTYFSHATVSGCCFVKNSARGGPGIDVDSAGLGGAIYAGGFYTIVNSTFYGNSGSRWDGLHVKNGVLEPAASAIYCAGQAYGTNITFCGNWSTERTISAFPNSSAKIIMKNSVFGKNRARLSDTGVRDQGYNLCDTVSPAFTETSSRNNIDVKLGELGDYGGPTLSIPLLAGSPAIDAGDDGAAPQTDQRGRLRTFGGRSDIGAFESSPPFILYGNVTGATTGTLLVTLGETIQQPERDGAFRFVVPAGQHTIKFSGSADMVLRPNAITLNITADTPATARAFKLFALAYDPDLPSPGFTFAAMGGSRWRFDMSRNLIDWTPSQTNDVGEDQLFSISLNSFASPTFIRAIRQP